MKITSIGILTLLVSACTWVKPKAGAESVVLVKAEHVSQCTEVGKVFSNTHHRVLGLNRHKEKVAEELLTLAQNEAHAMGADTLVALTGFEDGEQKFTAYKCRDAE